MLCTTGRKTLESVSAADKLVDALEMAAHEEERQREHEQQQRGKAQPQPLPPNIMMLGLDASGYVLRAVGAVMCWACCAVLGLDAGGFVLSEFGTAVCMLSGAEAVRE